MNIAELNQWSLDYQNCTDETLRSVARTVLGMLRERTRLLTIDRLTIELELQRARYDLASLGREGARLRGLLHSAPAPWDLQPIEIPDANSDP